MPRHTLRRLATAFVIGGAAAAFSLAGTAAGAQTVVDPGLIVTIDPTFCWTEDLQPCAEPENPGTVKPEKPKPIPQECVRPDDKPTKCPWLP